MTAHNASTSEAPGGSVLAAVDGSLEARDAVDVAAQLARSWEAELHVVHVWSGHASNLTAVVAAPAARRLLADEVTNAVARGASVSEQHFLVGRMVSGSVNAYHAEVELMRAAGATLGVEHASAGPIAAGEASLTADAHRLEDSTGTPVSVSVVDASPYSAFQGASTHGRR